MDVLEDVGLHPSNKRSERIYAEAKRFLAEKQTCRWLENENIKKGRAVTAMDLVSQYDSMLRDATVKEFSIAKAMDALDVVYLERKPGKHGLRVKASMRRWCCRFKAKWNLRHGQMHDRDFIPVDELRDKASSDG